jgi:hypothetical protein
MDRVGGPMKMSHLSPFGPGPVMMISTLNLVPRCLTGTFYGPPYSLFLFILYEWFLKSLRLCDAPHRNEW